VFATLPRFHRKAVCRWLVNETPPRSDVTQRQGTLAAGHYGVSKRTVAAGRMPWVHFKRYIARCISSVRVRRAHPNERFAS
jgi:hypothetical protein